MRALITKEKKRKERAGGRERKEKMVNVRGDEYVMKCNCGNYFTM